jgi:hypothetical protein
LQLPIGRGSVDKSTLSLSSSLFGCVATTILHLYTQRILSRTGAGDLVSQALMDEDNPDSQIPNFAHAALILQNSSSVYIRKVDYLYKLVYKALYDEFCDNTSSSKESSSHKSEGFYEFNPHMEFMLLDDVIPEDLTN